MAAAIQNAAPPERAALGALSSFAITIGVSRAVNFVRERRRRVPAVRSLARRAYHAPGGEELRIHHFVPGIALAMLAGGLAIFTRRDGSELPLSVVFGTGAGLTVDEFALLVDLDNAYWRTETLVLLQGALAAVAAAGVGARMFVNRGADGDQVVPSAGAMDEDPVTPQTDGAVEMAGSDGHR